MARILHLVAANHRRGAETFAVELAEYFRSAGHDVRVMAVSDARVNEPLPVEVAATTRYDPRGIARVVSAARWSDIVVSFGSSSLSVGAVAARLARRPFVYRQIGDPNVWGRVRASNLRIGAPARSAATVVALYPAAAEALVRLYGIDPDSIRVIPRGVPEGRFRPVGPGERATARHELGLDPDRRWVAYVGALSPEKDPLLAVDAIASLDDEIGLLIAGAGQLEGEIRARAQLLGDRVRVLGSVSDVGLVYAAADALVLPSRTEGVPGVAIEASLCGLPVVAFDVGGVSSVVLDDETGRIVRDRRPEAFAEDIVDALLNGGRFGSTAREHCLRYFSMRSVGQAWEQVIEQHVRCHSTNPTPTTQGGRP